MFSIQSSSQAHLKSYNSDSSSPMFSHASPKARRQYALKKRTEAEIKVHVARNLATSISSESGRAGKPFCLARLLNTLRRRLAAAPTALRTALSHGSELCGRLCESIRRSMRRAYERGNATVGDIGVMHLMDRGACAGVRNGEFARGGIR